MLLKIKKNIFIALSISILIYLAFIFYADFNDIIISLRNFDWLFFIIVIILSFLTFLTRYFKWEYGLKILDVKIKKSDSFYIFMSSLTMSITPGKVGDLIKSYMLKQTNGNPISQTAPLILIERLTEFLSLLFIGLLGLYLYEEWKYLIIISTILLLLFTILLSNSKITEWGLLKLSRIEYLKNHLSNLALVLSNSRKLLLPKSYLIMLIFSFVSWIFEGFGFHIILIQLGVDISLVTSFLIFAFSIIIGSMTMIPGGLGITEGSLMFLLIKSGIQKNTAVTATLLFRLATLWFALLLGSISLLIYQKKMGRLEL